MLGITKRKHIGRCIQKENIAKAERGADPCIALTTQTNCEKLTMT